MFSFAAIIVALLLFPGLLCVLILRLFFPKHTLRVNEVFLFSFGLAITLIFNLSLIFEVTELLVPKYSIGTVGFESEFFLNLLSNAHQVCISYFWYVTKPVAAIGATVWVVKSLYIRGSILRPSQKKNYFKLKRVRRFLYKIRKFKTGKKMPTPKIVGAFERTIGRKAFDFLKSIEKFCNDNFVNYMGQMTIYQSTKEQLFVDILDESNSLYSGIFIEYFLDDKKFVGLKLSNVIRFSFKSDKDRSNNKSGSDRPYLLPNNGEMYFPVEKIKNIHFWRISQRHEEFFDLSRVYGQIKFVWMCGIMYSLPHLRIKPIGVFPAGSEEDSDLDISSIDISIDTLNLSLEEIIPYIHFESDDSGSAR